MDYQSTIKESFGKYRAKRCDDAGNLCVVPSIDGISKQAFLTTNGLGTGTYNHAVNYSATPTDIKYTALSRYEIYSLLIVISDNANFNQVDYGAIPGGVTNGVKLFIKPVGMAEIPLLSGVAIKRNYEWLSLTTETHLTQFAGLPQTLTVNFDIMNDYGKPITLNTGDSFIVRLNDDFSTLVSHTFGLRGSLF